MKSNPTFLLGISAVLVGMFVLLLLACFGVATQSSHLAKASRVDNSPNAPIATDTPQSTPGTTVTQPQSTPGTTNTPQQPTTGTTNTPQQPTTGTTNTPQQPTLPPTSDLSPLPTLPPTSGLLQLPVQLP
ncbi:MAG TPA: hypothetical protein VGM01_00085 [Ktedonobacteraceae bacterium]